MVEGGSGFYLVATEQPRVKQGLLLKDIKLDWEDRLYFSTAKFLTGSELKNNDLETGVLENIEKENH